MSISFSCGKCGNDYIVSDALAGKSAICKACGARMTVPGGAAAVAPVEVEAIDEPASEVATATAPPPRAAFAGPTFATAKPAAPGGGIRRVIWLVFAIGLASFIGLRGIGVSSKSDVRAFFQQLVDLDQKIIATLKGVNDVPSAKAASGPLNEEFRTKIDFIAKNRKKKGRKEDIAAITAEYNPQLAATQQQIGAELLRVAEIPDAWEALGISDQIDRLQEEVTKESAKE